MYYIIPVIHDHKLNADLQHALDDWWSVYDADTNELVAICRHEEAVKLTKEA